MDIVDELNAAKDATGLSEKAIGEAVGLPRDAIAKIRVRKRELKYGDGLRLRQWLDDVAGKPQGRVIPIRGIISAGVWIEEEAQDLGTVECDEGGDATFGLQVSGDSMDQFVADGGVVAIDPDEKGLDAGKVYAVRRPDGDVTLKRFETAPARLVPMSTNPDHQIQILGQPGYQIIGRAVWRKGAL